MQEAQVYFCKRESQALVYFNVPKIDLPKFGNF